MSDHETEAIIVVIFLLLVVGRARVERLGQLDGLLQPGVQPVVGLVPKTSQGYTRHSLPFHVHKIRVKWLDWLLVSLVKSDIPLVKAVLSWQSVVVRHIAYVVVAAVAIVIVANIERLHQL